MDSEQAKKLSLGEQSDDGMWVSVGCVYSVLPPPGYHDCAETIALMMREFGRNFRPLWLSNFWRTWTGGIVRTVHHVTAHEDQRGLYDKNMVRIHGLLLPTTRLHGVTWRAPIFKEKGSASILDGLTDDERKFQGMMSRKSTVPGFRRRLPRYQPFDPAVTRRLLWETRHPLTESERQAQAAADKAAHEAQRLKLRQDLAEMGAYEKKESRVGKPHTYVPRTYVSERLQRLQAAAAPTPNAGAAA